jgi:hypothetical protein
MSLGFSTTGRVASDPAALPFPVPRSRCSLPLQIDRFDLLTQNAATLPSGDVLVR